MFKKELRWEPVGSSVPQRTQNTEDPALCQLWGRDRKPLRPRMQKQEDVSCEDACHPRALKGFQVSEFKRKEMSFKLGNLMGVRRLCDILQPHIPGRGGHERCPPRTKEPVCPGPAGDGPALAHVRSPCGNPQVNPHILYLKALF